MSLGAGRTRPYWHARDPGRSPVALGVRIARERVAAARPAMWEPLCIRPVTPADEPALMTLFRALDTRWFRPHDLGPAGAHEVATHTGKDVYLIGFLGAVPVAYGMLRGWDEGYRIPALGIAIRGGYRDRGLGRQMMRALHDVVRQRGGHRVRLRVAPENVRARHLYHSMGYRQVGVERGELVLLLDIDHEGAPAPAS